MDKAIRATIKKEKISTEIIVSQITVSRLLMRISFIIRQDRVSNVSIDRRMFEWGTPFPSIRELLDRVG